MAADSDACRPVVLHGGKDHVPLLPVGVQTEWDRCAVVGRQLTGQPDRSSFEDADHLIPREKGERDLVLPGEQVCDVRHGVSRRDGREGEVVSGCAHVRSEPPTADRPRCAVA